MKVKKCWVLWAMVVSCLLPAQAQLLGTWRNEAWVTHHTTQFDIHSPKSLAHRVPEVAAHAQQAYAALSQKLAWRPKHRIHILLTDDSDDANGWATVMPFGLVQIHLSPPDDVFFLDHYDNWLRTVVWHELTHVFHMDQAAGGQAAVQSLFGRLPLAFAHQYQPLWLLEGLAIDSESIAAARSGRQHNTLQEMRMRAEVEKGLADLNTASAAARVWPTDQAYLYGTWFYPFLQETLGPQALERWLKTYRASLPGFVNPAAKLAWGDDFDALWPKYQDWLKARFSPLNEPHPQGQAWTQTGLLDARPVRQGPWVYRVRYDAHKGHRLERYDGQGRVEVLGDLDSAGPLDVNARGDVVMARPTRTADGRYFHDLWLWRAQERQWQRITRGQRYRDVRWTADGQDLLAKQMAAGVSSLHLLDAKGEVLSRLWQGQDQDVLGAYSVRPDGRQVVAAVKRGFRTWNLEVFDVAEKSWRPLLQGPAVYVDPVYSKDGQRVLFTAEDGPAYNVFELDLSSRTLHRRSRMNTGAFTPIYAEDGGVVFQRYSARGYDLTRLPPQALLNELVSTLPAVLNGPAAEQPIPQTSVTLPMTLVKQQAAATSAEPAAVSEPPAPPPVVQTPAAAALPEPQKAEATVVKPEPVAVSEPPAPPPVPAVQTPAAAALPEPQKAEATVVQPEPVAVSEPPAPPVVQTPVAAALPEPQKAEVVVQPEPVAVSEPPAPPAVQTPAAAALPEPQKAEVVVQPEPVAVSEPPAPPPVVQTPAAVALPEPQKAEAAVVQPEPVAVSEPPAPPPVVQTPAAAALPEPQKAEAAVVQPEAVAVPPEAQKQEPVSVPKLEPPVAGPLTGLVHLASGVPRVAQAPVPAAHLGTPQDYSPWETLKPQFWVPLWSISGDRRQWGLVTGGRDASLRHTYDLTVAHDNVSDKLSGALNYRFDTRYQLSIERSFTEVREAGQLQSLEQTDEFSAIRLSVLRWDLDRLRLHTGLAYRRGDTAWVKPGVASNDSPQERVDVGVLLHWNRLRQNLGNVGGPGSGWAAAWTLEGQNRAADQQDWRPRMAFDGRIYQTMGDSHVAGARIYAAAAHKEASGYALGSFDPNPSSVALGRDRYPLRGYAEAAVAARRFAALTLDYRVPIARVNQAWGVHPLGLDNVYATAFVDHARADNKARYTGYGVELTAETRLLYFLRVPVTLGLAKGSDAALGERQVWLRASLAL